MHASHLHTYEQWWNLVRKNRLGKAKHLCHDHSFYRKAGSCCQLAGKGGQHGRDSWLSGENTGNKMLSFSMKTKSFLS